jgi:predicted flap endonuclease-1-like 5' DNA nuclease
MARGIHTIEGIGPCYAGLLKGVGISTTDQLLKAGTTARGRAALARQSGISTKLLLKWVNMCDLFRVRGVASQYAELLEAAGVDSVRELRNRNSENLAEALSRVNAEKRLVRTLPNRKRVNGWIEDARKLQPLVSY